MLIDDLKDIQSAHGFLPREKLLELSRRKSLPLYQIEGVASFYPHFRSTPPPAVEIAVCADMSCWLAGAERLEAEIRAEVGHRLGHPAVSTRKGVSAGTPASLVNGGRRTGESRRAGAEVVGDGISSADGTAAAADGASSAPGSAPAVEVHRVSCLGLCDRAPACAFGDRPVGGVTLDAVRRHLDAALDGGAAPARAHADDDARGAGTAPASGASAVPAEPSRIDPYAGGERYGALRALLRS